ncbi:MAG: hypothetical protein JG776_954 [Caloramator sp.]|nr:hypothetical protein [Caloramator sp.]
MKKFLPIIIIFFPQLFFAIFNIFGKTYEGRESSQIYIILNIIVYSLSIIIYFVRVFYKRIKFNKNKLLILFSIAVIIMFFFIEDALVGINSIGTKSFILFNVFAIPNVIMGIYISDDEYCEYLKSIEIIMLIFTISTIKTIYNTLILGYKPNIGGGSYQFAGYTAALALGINLCFIVWDKNIARFNIFKSKLYKILSYFLVIFQLVGVMTTGARGAMILVIFYLIYFLILVRNDRLSILNKICIVIIVIILYLNILPILINNSVFNSSLRRLFEYVSDNGINWEGTSGRDIIYILTIELIKLSPIYGYGLFSYYNYLNSYPHNLFLEILVQGGIIYLSIFIIINYLVIKKLNKITRKDVNLKILNTLAIYCFVLLMFSGTYMTNNQFWFILSFVVNFKTNKQIN